MVTKVNPPELVIDKNSGKHMVDPPVSNKGTEITIDAKWVKNSFLVSDVDLKNPRDKVNRYWSTAKADFTDTSVGGNIGLNPWPQFTQYADIPEPGLYVNRQESTVSNISGNYGKGRFYTEAFDNNRNLIFLRFGLPQFNSLGRFFTLAIDRNMASLANKGRSHAFARNVGRVVGTVLSLAKVPILAVAYWGIKLGGEVLSRITPNASSKYYTLRPEPVLYYSAVTNLFNMMAINRGVLPASMTTDGRQEIGETLTVNQSVMDNLKKIMPDIFSKNLTDGSLSNYIDVYAIVSRAQRIANYRFDREIVELDKTGVDYAGYVDNLRTETVTDPNPTSFASLIKNYTEYNDSNTADDDEHEAILMAKDPLASYEAGTTDGFLKGAKQWWEDTIEYYNGMRNDGADFVPLIVEHTGTVQESFSNSVKDSNVASVINSTSEGTRSTIFNLAGGNLGDNVIADTVEKIAGSVKEVAMGALEVLTLNASSIITALLGGGYVDVPKQWDNSSFTLTKNSYTMSLVQPYGHPVSLLLHTDLIIAIMLAGVLPIATGKASYTSPFLCELIHPGRQQTPLGIIDNLSITRGTTNLGFNNNNQALGVEISFSVVDLSSIMSVPISDGDIGLNMDDDNVLVKYLSTLAGRDLQSQYYALPQTKIRIANELFNAKKYHSAAGAAMAFNYSTVGRIMNLFAPQSDVLRK